MLAIFRFFTIILQQTNHEYFDVMKRFILSIFVLGIAVSSLASAYQGDVIYIDGERWTLMGQPVERDSALFHHLLDVLPKERRISSGNWQGYTGYWSIRDGQLYLDSIRVGFDFDSSVMATSIFPAKNKDGKEIPPFVPADDMHEIFHDYYVGGEILASWITGEVRVARGHAVKYVHQGYMRSLEHEQYFTISQGRVTDCVAYHNRIAAKGFSIEEFNNRYRKQDSESREKIRQLIPIPAENYPDLAGVKGFGCDVSDIQVDSLGNLVDCRVKIDLKGGNDELKERLSQDAKAALMNIRPWKVLCINNEYIPDAQSFWFRYDLEQ
jgi:hypothetical protein